MQMTGLLAWYAGDITNELKQAIMLFDKIAYRHYHTNAECEMFSATIEGKRTLKQVDMLYDKGYFVDIPEIELNVKNPALKNLPNLVNYLDELNKPALKAIHDFLLNEEQPERAGRKYETDTTSEGFRKKDLFCRLASIDMNKNKESEVTPLLSGMYDIDSVRIGNKQNVIQIVFDNIPATGEDTPWEAIFDFKNDNEGRNKFFRLKNWITKTAKKNNDVGEIQDEINEMIFEYNEYMQLQHKKIRASKLETMIVGTAELIEGLAEMKISKSLKTFLGLRKLNLQLFESELSAPGKELAYISDCKSLAANKRVKEPWWKVF